jgi:hypothetical protein
MDRKSFCLKETVNSSRRECGTTAAHPFDEWDVKGGQCVYRKCSPSCQNETMHFKGRDGAINSRQTTCCAKKLCNAGSSIGHSQLRLGLLLMSVITWLTI